MTRHYPLLPLILFPVILLLSGCSASRPDSHSDSMPPEVPVVPQHVATAAAELSAAPAATPWQSVSLPVSLKVRDAGMPKVSGTLTMVRDREIRLSFRFLGMEMGALSVTSDSVKGYVKLRKVYLSETIAELMGGYPATTGNLQSLLLGQLFTIGAPAFEREKAEITASGANGYTITPAQAPGDLGYSFEATLPANRLTGVIFNRSTTRATVLYTDFSTAWGSVARPGEIDITVAAAERVFGAELTLNYGRASVDRDLTLRPLEIPRGYTRISSSALLKAISEI